MKKNNEDVTKRQLTFNRETVRPLHPEELYLARGGCSIVNPRGVVPGPM